MIEKKARPDVFVKGLKTKHEHCKAKLEASEATRIAASKKHKSEIEGLKIMEKSALDAASTSSKLVDDTLKEVIGSKADKIREMRRQISDLTKEVKDGKALQVKVGRLKSEVEILTKEKSALFQEKSSLSTNKAYSQLSNTTAAPAAVRKDPPPAASSYRQSMMTQVYEPESLEQRPSRLRLLDLALLFLNRQRMMKT
jgi:hypothetical protein